MFDDEKTGAISIQTLRRFGQDNHLNLDELDFEEIMRQSDENHDGKVSFEEFYSVITKEVELVSPIKSPMRKAIHPISK